VSEQEILGALSNIVFTNNALPALKKDWLFQ
jgi:hypothetical protein